MRPLYEIDAAIMACCDPETGEIFDPEALTNLMMEREAKFEAVGLYIKNLNAEADAIKAEKDALAKREKTVRALSDGYAEWLKRSLAGEKFKTARLQVSFRNNDKVVQAPDAVIPEQYKRVKTEVAPDLIEIKKALKNGEVIDGFRLEKSLSMTIK